MDFLQSVAAYLPSALMLILGFGLMVVEMYVPGFGLPGIAGILLLVGGVIVARPSPVGALAMALGIVALLCVALSVCIRSASSGRLFHSKLVLKDVATQPETQETNDLNYFIGREGVTHTVLRPAGMADFDGVKLNVVFDGEYIPAGTRVVVARVEGNRILVREKREA